MPFVHSHSLPNQNMQTGNEVWLHFSDTKMALLKNIYEHNKLIGTTLYLCEVDDIGNVVGGSYYLDLTKHGDVTLCDDKLIRWMMDLDKGMDESPYVKDWYDLINYIIENDSELVHGNLSGEKLYNNKLTYQLNKDGDNFVLC